MKYKCIHTEFLTKNNYLIVPYREEDIFLIMKWRNEQIDVLRQNKPLIEEEQIKYFNNYIKTTFTQDKPQQILFSYLKNNTCIGYGGLTNIDWINQRAELSFLVETSRTLNESFYEEDFSTFIDFMKYIIFKDLKFNRLYTETYEFRKFHISILEKNGFILEGILRQHIFFKNNFINSLIHSIIRQDYEKF